MTDNDRQQYRKGNYTMVPNNHHLKELDTHAQCVFFWLCQHADKMGQCYPSQKQIAEVSGMSPRTVRRKIDLLEKEGLISKRKQERDDGGNSNDQYQINLTPTGSNDRTPQDTDSQPPRTELPTNNKQKNNNQKNNNIDGKPSIAQASSEEKTEGELVNDCIYWFESVNPAIENIYGHKAQRDAAEFLLEKFEFNELKNFVEVALPKLNGKQYFPAVTTPHQMMKKLGKIQNYFKKEQDKQEKQGNTIRGLDKLQS